MFSNIPINLLSETQLGGCTALSCVLGRRREERGRGELTFVPTRRGNVCEPTVCAHTHSYTHLDTHWLDVATEYISSLVGLYVDFRSVRACTAIDSQMTSSVYASVKQWCAAAEPTRHFFHF